MANLSLLGSGLLSVCLAALASSTLAGCDGSGHPDTGYGAGQAVPSTINCADLCQRAADCGGHLCTEDTGKSAYIDMFTALEPECESTCTPAALASKLTNATWTCFFKSSCRQIFAEDACHAQASYHCK